MFYVFYMLFSKYIYFEKENRKSRMNSPNLQIVIDYFLPNNEHIV